MSVCTWYKKTFLGGFFLLAVHLVSTYGRKPISQPQKFAFPDIGIYKGPLFQKEPPFLPQTRLEAALVEWSILYVVVSGNLFNRTKVSRQFLATFSNKIYLFRTRQHHTTQESGGVWFIIPATPKHQIVVSHRSDIVQNRIKVIRR